MQQLIKEVLSGKRGAATRFYRELAPVVRRYLRVKLAKSEDVEEITQDVFLSALDSLPLFRGEAEITTWLLSIARHEVADYYRKRYVRRAVEKTAPLLEELLVDVKTPEFELKKQQMRKRFIRAYTKLSQQHQDVLSYKFELGMSVREIARKMEMSFKATESTLYRARMAFKTEYEAQQ
ncbi:MAG: RNA polymerase sigma factor [bacterium]